ADGQDASRCRQGLCSRLHHSRLHSGGCSLLRTAVPATKLSAPARPHEVGASDVRACPACGAATQHRFCFLSNGCDIWQCESCGLGRADTVAFDPATYYTKDYFSGGHVDGYADYLAAEPVLQREFARSVEVIRKYRAGGKLLELGCAYGFFLQEAKRYFDVAGIELAADAAEHCRRAGLNVLQGAVDETSLGRIGRVDVIVLLDVIEH